MLVLIDLKLGKLSHADLGRMQMYVNYFDRFVKLEATTKDEIERFHFEVCNVVITKDP